MHALLKIGLFAAMLCCAVTMIRHAWRPNGRLLVRAGLLLRVLTVINAVLLAAWLVGLVRH